MKRILLLCAFFAVLLIFSACKKARSHFSLEGIQADLLANSILENPNDYETKCEDGLPYLKCTTSYNEDGSFKSFDCDMEWNAQYCYVIKKEDTEGGADPAPPNEWSSNTTIYEISGDRISDFANYFAPIKIGANNGATARIKAYVKSPSPFNQVIANWSSGGSNVGESFVSISVNGHTRVFGYFPLQPINPNSFVNGPSIIIDKSGSAFDLELKFSLSNTELLSFISNLENNYVSNQFSIKDNSDTALVRDLLLVIKPSFVFSSVPYPNNIGTGLGSNSGYLAYDIDSKSYEFNMAIYNNTGGNADLTK